MPDSQVTWTVVIPVKGTPAAKSRLGGSTELALAIALDSVQAARDAARVIVVTTEDAALDFEALGAEVIVDSGGGLNAACRQGIAAAGGGPVAVMLGDVPALRAAELRGALELAGQHPLAFVPDADNEGTTLITALRADRHRPSFGTGSRAAHLQAGYVELDLSAESGLRRDVDTPSQLNAIPRERLGSHTRVVLSSAG